MLIIMITCMPIANHYCVTHDSLSEMVELVDTVGGTVCPMSTAYDSMGTQSIMSCLSDCCDFVGVSPESGETPQQFPVYITPT